MGIAVCGEGGGGLLTPSDGDKNTDQTAEGGDRHVLVNNSATDGGQRRRFSVGLGTVRGQAEG